MVSLRNKHTRVHTQTHHTYIQVHTNIGRPVHTLKEKEGEEGRKGVFIFLITPAATQTRHM